HKKTPLKAGLKEQVWIGDTKPVSARKVKNTGLKCSYSFTFRCCGFKQQMETSTIMLMYYYKTTNLQ
ncbi:MAG: hypothetical protein V3V19_10990, partial [Cocleimonas sp.]